MSDNFSTASTVAPGDSVSVIAAPVSSGPAQGNGKARNVKSPKNAIAKDTPPGAVQVPKPTKVKVTNPSKPVESAIPLTGWSDLDITASRVETIPTFTVDANPYVDLIRAEFDRIVSRSPSMGKHIPFALFQYYCLTLFWFTVLSLVKANGQVLSTDSKNFLNAFLGGEDFNVPTHIAQYLANMGNFVQGAETFYFRLLNFSFGGKHANGVVPEGWLDCGNASTRVTTGPQFWAYSQLPVPAVSVLSVTNEVAFNDPANPGLNSLDHVTPSHLTGNYYPTRNIVGYITSDYMLRYNHSSHRSSYANLGWSDATIPSDMQTAYLFSASSMRWMSDKLATIRELKLHSSKQLNLSVNGSPMQAYWLEEPDKFHTGDEPDYLQPESRPKASEFLQLALVSRFSVDPKALTPAFDFGYRIARSKVLRDYDNRQPRFHDRSNFQPWILVDDALGIQDPPAALMVGMNDTWIFGSSGNLNFVRFATPVMRRDLALQSSLLLVNQ